MYFLLLGARELSYAWTLNVCCVSLNRKLHFSLVQSCVLCRRFYSLQDLKGPLHFLPDMIEEGHNCFLQKLVIFLLMHRKVKLLHSFWGVEEFWGNIQLIFNSLGGPLLYVFCWIISSAKWIVVWSRARLP